MAPLNTLVVRSSGAAVGPLPSFRSLLEEKLDEILRRRHDVSIERVAEPQEQAQIFARNETEARQIEHDREQLRLVRDALCRLDGGTFGVCRRCEGAIKLTRLAAVPWAPYCRPCQETAEAEAQAPGEEVGLEDLCA